MIKSSWLTLSLLALLLVPSAWPQASLGRVSGTVRDNSSAVIPNVSVVMTNTATNVRSSTRTNDVGFYAFPGVAVSSYRMSIEAPGMEKFEATFTVQVSQSVVIDPVLKTGQSLTTVDVKAAAPMVVSQNSALSAGMEHQRMEQLPVNGRSFGTLIDMLPGNEGSRMNGSQSGSRDWIVDGASQVDRHWDDPPFAGAGLDSIQEFTVDSNAVSARHSRPVSYIFSTKSGTNQLHGSAFETTRNNAIGLARARTDFYNSPPPLIRNEFGVSAGAPLVIPKVYDGRNKTFWFFNYEALRLVQSKTAGFTVPTMAARNGDFSDLRDSQGRLQVLYDPWTTDTRTGLRQPFAYGGKANVIDPSRISPVARYLFAMTPAPTTADNPLVTNNWFGPQSAPDRRYQTTVRLDHRFSERDSVYGVVNDGVDLRVYDVAGTFGGGAQGMEYANRVAGWQYYRTPQRSLATTWVHIFSPALFNELVTSVRHQAQIGYEGDGSGVNGDVNWANQFKLPNPFNSKNWPFFMNTGLSSYALTTNDTKSNWMTYYILDDNVTKIHGKHEFQFGGHYRFDQLNSLAKQRYPQPWVDWGTQATALLDSASSLSSPQAVPQTGSNLANMFLGTAWYQNSLTKGMYYLREKENALYFQDNFKATPRLTLNFGLRWEYWPNYSEKNHITVGFDRANHAIVTGLPVSTLVTLGQTTASLVALLQSQGIKFETPDQAGMPESMLYARKNNFGPRLGFAYKITGGASPFVLRGGYSRSYFMPPLTGWNDNNQQDTPLQAQYNYNPNDATQTPDGFPNYLLRSVPVYVDGVNSANAVNINQPRGIAPGSSISNYLDPHLPVATTSGWNLTLEKEVMSNTLARVRYVGSHTTGLGQNYSYNATTPAYIWYAATGQPLPTGTYANTATRFYDQTVYGTVQEYRGTGFSNDNSLQFELERRFNKGYAFQVSYVLSNAFAATGTMNELNQYMPDIVPADYDQRNRALNYQRDTGIPKHRVKWNWLLDLPVGRGKLLGGNARGILDKLIGGWQLAGLGTLRSTYFTLPTANWSFTGAPIEQYGYQYPIEDCRSGSCIPGYLWWNGYIPPNQINSHDANGKPNGYEGIPSNYKPVQTPLIPWGSATLPANAPANTNISSFWDTNNVWVPLKNGTVQRIAYGNGLNPWRNQYLPSVLQWGLDASLFKNIPIHERVNLRFNADFFNVLNHPGNPNSVGGDGFLKTQNSGQSPRVLQLSLRLTW